jgi:diadenosine tetraphosphate (Ap4A) HIT family hydrolase
LPQMLRRTYTPATSGRSSTHKSVSDTSQSTRCQSYFISTSVCGGQINLYSLQVTTYAHEYEMIDETPTTGICPFCDVQADCVWAENDKALALYDGYPLSEGHTLVVPRKHVASLFQLSVNDQMAVWRLVAEVRADLAMRFGPDGFNIGLNDGQAAGQTVSHAHIHVIPRRVGDVPDPRGGVRWVLPEKAQYWEDDS